MGYDYRAVSIIGCRVPAHKIVPVHKTECGCPLLGYSPKFCPSCGKPYTFTSKVNVDGLDDDRFRGLDAVECDGYCYVGLMYRTTDEYSRDPVLATAPQVLDCVNRVQGVLQPCGLWDASQYGVWTILSGG